MISLSTEIWKAPIPTTIPPYVVMWALAGTLFIGLKILILVHTPRLTFRRDLCFLALWPGMDPKPFAQAGRVSTTGTPRENRHLTVLGTVGCFTGAGLIMAGAHAPNPLGGGVLGMLGIVAGLHFGLFHLLTVLYRRLAIPVRPIMGNPITATSLNHFWGRTWNRAFADGARQLIGRPLTRRLGPTSALFVVFLISGLAHELVISVPAGAGYGGPTVYFLMQALGIHAHRARWIPLARTPTPYGRLVDHLYVAAFTLLPLPLLFHPPFLEDVIHPFTIALTNLIG